MVGLFIPSDGRTTSQNVLTSPLDSTSVIDIVSPGNVSTGNSYQVSLATLAGFFGSYYNPTFVKTTYSSVATDTRLLVQLNPVNPIAITILPSSSYTQPILVKDTNGTVSAVNTVTIDFSGGQLADGQSSITLQNAYAGIWLNPLANGFYITNA